MDTGRADLMASFLPLRLLPLNPTTAVVLHPAAVRAAISPNFLRSLLTRFPYSRNREALYRLSSIVESTRAQLFLLSGVCRSLSRWNGPGHGREASRGRRVPRGGPWGPPGTKWIGLLTVRPTGSSGLGEHLPCRTNGRIGRRREEPMGDTAMRNCNLDQFLRVARPSIGCSTLVVHDES